MKESQSFNSVKTANQLMEWYSTPTGQVLSKELSAKLEQLLPSLFGYYALQLGQINLNIDLLQSSAIGQKFYMAESARQGTVTASPLALPFSHDALDLIVLPHTLDFSKEPHQVLREVHRVLISEGHVVLIGFNPISMMGLSKLAFIRSKRVPWRGHFYTARRLKDWLSLLDFTVLNIHHVGLRPPLQNHKMLQRLEFMTKANRFGIEILGSIQIIIAKKRVLTLTPRPQPWLTRRRILPVNVAEPSARQANSVGTSRYFH